MPETAERQPNTCLSDAVGPHSWAYECCGQDKSPVVQVHTPHSLGNSSERWNRMEIKCSPAHSVYYLPSSKKDSPNVLGPGHTSCLQLRQEWLQSMLHSNPQRQQAACLCGRLMLSPLLPQVGHAGQYLPACNKQHISNNMLHSRPVSACMQCFSRVPTEWLCGICCFLASMSNAPAQECIQICPLEPSAPKRVEHLC